MTRPKRVRRSGSPWRILVHDWLGKKGVKETGFPYGRAHHVTNDPEFGRLPASVMGEEARKRADELRDEHSTTTVLPGTEFDELVVGRWLHVEAMSTGRYGCRSAVWSCGWRRTGTADPGRCRCTGRTTTPSPPRAASTTLCGRVGM